MDDLIDEPIPGSLKGFIRNDVTEKKPGTETTEERIFINRYAGKEKLTKHEMLDQLSIWTGALFIHECK